MVKLVLLGLVVWIRIGSPIMKGIGILRGIPVRIPNRRATKPSADKLLLEKKHPGCRWQVT